MSVMACGRKGCEEIMCNRLILDSSAYICGDCYEELLLVKKSWPKEMAALDVGNCIRAFMDTEPRSFIMLDAEGIDKEFERLTGN